MFCTQWNTAVSSVPALLTCVSSGAVSPIGESMYMGDPVVQHYGNHLDLVGGNGVPSLFHEGTLHRRGVEDHSSSSSGLAGDFDTGPDRVQVGDGCAAGDEN